MTVFMTDFFSVIDNQNQTWVLLKPNLGPRFCEEIHGPSLLTSKFRHDASLPHLMPPWHADMDMEPFVGFLGHQKKICTNGESNL